MDACMNAQTCAQRNRVLLQSLALLVDKNYFVNYRKARTSFPYFVMFPVSSLLSIVDDKPYLGTMVKRKGGKNPRKGGKTRERSRKGGRLGGKRRGLEGRTSRKIQVKER